MPDRLIFVLGVFVLLMIAVCAAQKKPKPEQIDHDAVTQRIEAKIDRLERTVGDQHEALIKRLETCGPIAP
jgi:hypothetical protein